MSLTSLGFFVFLLVTFLLYYICPRLQKYTLLAASLVFYFSAAGTAGGRLPILICYILAVTYVGALLLETLSNGMNMLGVASFWQDVITGFVLIFAVTLDIIKNRRKGSSY